MQLENSDSVVNSGAGGFETGGVTVKMGNVRWNRVKQGGDENDADDSPVKNLPADFAVP